MKQVTQRPRDGRIEVLDVPPPVLRPEGVLVDVRASLLSAGTERSTLQVGRQGLLGKARARPDQARAVIDKARRDGVRSAADAVRTRLDRPTGLGYSAAGVVLEVGARVTDLAPGDRVACAGGGHAEHAEIDYVPSNLCARLPDGVSYVEAAFTTVGSVALHGVRQAEVGLGERTVVIGLGLVGQLTCQLLRAAGCRVAGVDVSRRAVDRALSRGVVDAGFVATDLRAAIPPAAAAADAVLITAATRSDDPVALAARLCRDRGRVVVVGDVGMVLPRAAYYEKELEVRLSRSYGPGRYDPLYEEKGLDYPIGYVRWTERRNMAAFVELLASGRIDVRTLVTDTLPVERAPEAYERLLASTESVLGVVLEYGPSTLSPPRQRGRERRAAAVAVQWRIDAPQVGLIGAGSFAQRMLIPALSDAGFALRSVASARGLSARTAADRFGFTRVATPDEVLEDPDDDLVVIATRHASHAALAEAALRRGKAVFVEKPPCLDADELQALRTARAFGGGPLTVGFNRRHAPLASAMRDHMRFGGGPIDLLHRVTAGPVVAGHWLDDPDEGGGRLVGEGCHFVDFALWLVGAAPVRVSCTPQPAPGEPLAGAQRFSIAVTFDDGSSAVVVYTTAGAPRLAKERVEAHAAGRSAILDDFRSLTLYAGSTRRRTGSRRRDKGHAAQMRQLRAELRGERPAVAPDPLTSMAVTLAALRSAESGAAVALDAEGSAGG
jgi:predicted dehydrogenase/threonine dehydrogenase-like Zn-dependent dehydrogenase